MVLKKCRRPIRDIEKIFMKRYQEGYSMDIYGKDKY